MSTTVWSVWEAIRQLEMRVQTLEYENRELRQKMERMKKPFRVKKVVYHVHALHIQEMKGTMNIGITAPLDEQEMERLVLEMQREED